MSRRHTLVIALVLAAAAAAGALAAMRTVRLGTAASKPVSQAAIARRTQALDRFQARLERALARATATAAAPAAPPQQIVYRRPAAKVVVVHRSHESERETDGAGGGDD